MVNNYIFVTVNLNEMNTDNLYIITVDATFLILKIFEACDATKTLSDRVMFTLFFQIAISCQIIEQKRPPLAFIFFVTSFPTMIRAMCSLCPKISSKEIISINDTI